MSSNRFHMGYTQSNCIGSWFLDNPDVDWIPPPSLVKWMQKARDDKKPIVYIGFGSITVPNPSAVTEKIIQAVLKSTLAFSSSGDATKIEPLFPRWCKGYHLQGMVVSNEQRA